MFTLNNILKAAKAGSVYYDTTLYSKRGDYRMLMSSCEFELSDGKILSIAPGMYWDENSVPYILQWAFPKSGMYAIPALIHDALYFETSTTQRYADNEFKLWMQALEVSKWQVWFRYWAVRVFGGGWWRKNLNNPRERALHNRKLITIKDVINTENSFA